MDQHVAALLGTTRIGYRWPKDARYPRLHYPDSDWFRRGHDGNIIGNIAIAIRINTYRREIGRKNDNLWRRVVIFLWSLCIPQNMLRSVESVLRSTKLAEERVGDY